MNTQVEMNVNNKFTYKGKEYLIKKGKEYTAQYKKYQREQVKASNGEKRNTIEPELIYNITTQKFIKKYLYINLDNSLKKEWINKGYILNSYGNIVVKEQTEPDLLYTILIEFLVTTHAKEDKGIIDIKRHVWLNEKQTIKFNNFNKDKNIYLRIEDEKHRIKNLLEDSSVVVISNEVQLIHLNQMRNIKFDQVNRVKMKGITVVNLSSPAIGANHDNIETPDCVPRAILNHVNNPNEQNPRKRFKKITMNDILSLLNGIDPTKSDNVLNTIFNGYDSEQVLNVFTYFKIPAYALDHRRHCFLSNLKDIKDNRNKDMNSFVYMCWNNHMYVIENASFREHIFKSACDGSKMKIGSKQSKTENDNKKIIIPIIECKYKSNKKLKVLLDNTKEISRFICTNINNIVHDLFYNEIAKGIIHDNEEGHRDLKIVDASIVRFAYKQHTIEYNPDYFNIKSIVKTINEPLIIENNKLIKEYEKKLSKLKNDETLTPPKLYKIYKVENATFHSLALQYFQLNFGIQLSQLGEQGDQVMNSPLNSAFNEFWDYPEDMTNYHGYDIRKQYSSILRSVSLGWSVYNPMNEINKFSGTLQEGFYYVESKNYFPLKGNGWYSGEPLIEYLADGIIKNEDIKYEFLPTTILPGDYFKNFVNEIYEKFGTDAKQAINGFIGMLRINQSTKKDNYFFNDVESLFMHMNDSSDSTFRIIKNDYKNEKNYDEPIESKSIYWKDGDEPIEIYNKYIEESEILAYHAMNEKKYPLTYNSTPIHRKIYDIAALQIYRLAKAVGIKFLFGIKTDALFFNGGDKLTPNEDTMPIGGIRFEPLKTREHCNFKCGYPREYEFKLEDKVWQNDIDIFDMDKGSMVTGCAGTGKSYKAKELTQYLTENNINYRVCAPTKAAAIIHEGGETIHKLFGFDPFAPVLNISRLNELINANIKVIIVDEISMINANIWGLLLKIKKFCKFTFFGFGDAAQCAPVKEEKQFKHYFSSALCYELFDNRHIELIENFRCKNDVEFADLNEEFIKARKGDKIDISKFGNKICDRAIAYTNEQCRKHNEFIMNKYKNDESIKLNNMWVYEGLPVKAVRNNNLWSNNEQFNIIEYSNKDITIKSNVQKDEKGEFIIYKIDHKLFTEFFECSYCTTVHSAQGQTYDFEFTIYEYNVMSTNILYTALSRTTKKANINLIFRTVEKSFIYGCINLLNNKYYIGSTVNFIERVKQHEESKENDKFHKALRDEGLQNFQFVKLFEGYLNEKALLVKEQEYINKYNSIEQGYNSKNAKNN